MDLLPFGFLEFGIKDFFETLIIATVLYFLYRAIRGSYAIPAFTGIIIIFIINAVVSALGLNTINFILRKIMDVGILAVFIIFQPEIRRLLYSLGRNTKVERWGIFGKAPDQQENVISEVIEAVKTLTRTKTGALIVFTRSGNLQDLIDPGVKIDAKVSRQLILTIFNKETPLHDGAVIIKDQLIERASCHLPLSNNTNLQQNLGTRHRAAVGATESNDAFVVVVSEETGRISIANNGTLESGLTIQKLRQQINENLQQDKKEEVDFGTPEMKA